MSLFITTKKYLFFLTFLVGHIYSHEIVVSKIQIEEQNQSNYKISWVRPKLSNFKDVKLSVNSECSSISNYKYQITKNNYISSWDVGCGMDQLFFIEAEGINTNVEIFVSTVDEEEKLIGTISLNNNKIYVDQINPSNDFFMLGVSHMFGGLDHLVVVLLFTLMATTSIGLIKTITAFTLGHSLTLALAYLGVFSISQSPIEALIALTIIALSLKLLTLTKHNNDSIYIAAFFGLIHGFGFYGVLDEISVDENVIANLFFFNIGIEVAQFLFIGILLLLAWGAKGLFQLDLYKRNDFIAYSTGGIGMYWLIDRLITIT
tara:strand:- start:464 stop:1417 length:954 start_codon:yes stop_codon:yes gene_type:complete